MKSFRKKSLFFILGSVLLLGSFSFFSVPKVRAQQNLIDDVLEPSLQLLGAGTRWAARGGSSVLYVNWKDNWLSHGSSDGIDWLYDGWIKYMDDYRISITKALNYANFNIEYVGDIPDSLTKYDVVLISAYFAAEPHHAPIIRDYIKNGGAVVILYGVPCYLSVYCKDNWPGRSGGDDLSSIYEWFGARYYRSTTGSASVIDENPFDTLLSYGDVVFSDSGDFARFVCSLGTNTEVIAQWDSNYPTGYSFSGVPYYYENQVFAFTHEYGNGRVYYQAGFEIDIDEDVYVESIFVEIDPKIDLQPSSGLSQTTIKGSGFQPNSEITVTWNRTTVYTVPDNVKTDRFGNFTAIISVLDQTNTGDYKITIIDAMENEASSTFTVIPEFPSLIIAPLSLVTMFAAILLKKRLNKHQSIS